MKNFVVGCIFIFLCTPSVGQWATIQEMNADFEHYFATEDSVTLSEWTHALPTDLEKSQMRQLIGHLMEFSTFQDLNTTAMMSAFPELSDYITLTILKKKYAVLHEILRGVENATKGPKYKRFWGYIVVTAKNFATQPHFHHSSPHFQSDGNVGNESAAIFEATHGRTLTVAGASRYAVRERVQNPCEAGFALADAAHNNETMFYIMNEGVLKTSNAPNSDTRGYRTENYFIQWHGMAETSCPKSPVLMSAGVKHNDDFYANHSTILSRLANAYGPRAHNPAQDPDCNLSATTNVFGRLINGVNSSDVCYINASHDTIHGKFIHIEQKEYDRENWKGWIHAINSVYSQL